MNFDEIPPKIQWHEGLMLTQQHFQQFSLRSEMLLQAHVTAISPFHWGILQLKYDTGSLVAGVLKILTLEAILPDSLLVSYNSSSPLKLELDLNAHLAELKDNLITVNIAVPVSDIDLLNRDLARYISAEGALVKDTNTGDNELRIPRLLPSLRLLVGEHPSAKYIFFPMLKIKYTNETFIVSDYVPATLKVAADSPLGSLCATVIKRLREKALYLADQIQSSSYNAAMPISMENKSVIARLVSGLPLIEALLSSGVCHPFQLYLALCAIAGQLAGIGTSLVPPVFAPYDHNNLLTTFEQVTEYIFRALTEGVAQSYSVIRFRYESNVFSAYFQADWLHKRIILGMRGQQGTTERELLEWAQECIIGARTKMQLLREQRILGAVRQRIDYDEELLPIKGVMLFSLKADAEFIEPNEILQIFNSGDRAGARPPAEIIMYIMK